ncbi:hypothetical protein HYZ70_02515 [Candidatus Curtissbacteria bacterium]|nr:hypothetical protein [Candidatus Curtissbacteria bacterium]
MKYLIPLAFAVALFFYHPVLDFYFFQDDFFEINISQAQNFGQYLSFFKFRDDIIAYRPISLENYFFISRSLFDLNPIGFRLITFFLFFLSGLAIYKLAQTVFKNTQTAVVAGFLWLTSSIHFMSLTWIAAAYNIIGTFFYLAASVVFLKYLKNKKIYLYILSFLIFIVTIGSYEFSVTWPAIWGFYYFFVLKNPLLTSLKLFSPYIIVSAAYILIRLIFIKVPQIPEYQIAVGVDSIKSYLWYLLWTFNIPEEFKKQAAVNLIGLRPIFLAEFWTLTAKSFISFLYLIILAVAVPVFLVVKEKINLNIRLIFFFLAFFTIAISPVLILPNHTFSMYLTLAAVGLYALLAYLLAITNNRLLLASVLAIWLFSSATTVGFYRHNSWMIESQKTARTFAVNMLEKFPSLPKNSIAYYHLPYSWQHQALGDGHAIKTIYNDQTLSIYYNEKNLRKDFGEGKLKGAVYVYYEE